MKNILHTLLLMLAISTVTTHLLHAQSTVLNFDGDGDYVDCGNILPSSYTKEAWIYITDLKKVNNIMSGDDNSKHVFWAYPGPLNNLSSGHTTVSEVIDLIPLLENTWYHVAVTYDAPTTTMRLYKNGVLVSQNTQVAAIGNNAKLYIGNFTTNNYVFAGNMDNVRIWSIARTGNDISMNINTTYTTAQPNLVANYTFNQGSAGGNNVGSNLIDASTNNNTGILVGFTLIGGSSNFITANVVLPVELLSFKATAAPQPPKGEMAVRLTWATVNETNNKGFEVERLKVSGSDWETLGFVKAQGKTATYEFMDNTPNSTNYYRLRQMDNDGKEVMSKVVSAFTKSTSKFKVYPNPVSNVLITDLEANSDFQIFNLLGQQVQSGQTALRLDVSALPQGTYVMKVGTEQARFMKQ